MCGIVGYFQLQGEPNPSLPRFVRAARDRLTHRGPDDEGLYVSLDGLCVLGSRRLSIIDLSNAANQPMPNEDATVWLVFNGEIYNYIELRKALVAKGHLFRSASDTEVILHLYEEHGLELVHDLDGIFSFVIYDSTERRLFGARDRLGVKPFYYAHSAKRFAFASEPKALLALPDVGREPRPEELPSYLTFSCVPGPSTLFRDIEKLEPGMLFELRSDGSFHKERYWLPGEGLGDEKVDSRNLADELGNTLAKAVTKRMVGDVPIGSTLSGGIDSSLIVALMTEARGAPVKTFTVGYPGDEADASSDLRYARLVARQFGSDHHEVIITHEKFLALLDQDLPALTDDPIGSPSQTAIAHLARFATRNGVTVIQIGEGSDEIFCGYTSVYQLWRFHERLAVFGRLFPRRVAGLLARGFGSWLRKFAINPSKIGSMDGTVLEHLRRYSRGEHSYWGYGQLFCVKDQEELFGRTLSAAFNPYERLRTRIAEVSDFGKHPFLDQLAIIDLMLALPERLLMRVDKASMLYGVEAREPFLDSSVLKLAFQIPSTLRGSSEKGFLRGYASQKLSAEILSRPKRGFPTAATVFMAPAVLARIRESVLAKRFLEFTGFDQYKLKELITACEAGPAGFFSHLWAIYILSSWFHHWVDGKR